MYIWLIYIVFLFYLFWSSFSSFLVLCCFGIILLHILYYQYLMIIFFSSNITAQSENIQCIFLVLNL